MNVKNFYGEKIYIPIVYIIAFFVTIPAVFYSLSPGLDPSWVLVYNLENIFSFQFGKDIVYTFGPLGFMWLPSIINYTFFWVTAGFHALIHGGLVLALYYFSVHSSRKIYQIIPLLSLPFIIYLAITFKLIILVVLVLFLYSRGHNPNHRLMFLPLLAGILLAVGSLVKFEVFLNAIVLLLLYICIHLAIRSRRQIIASFPLFYIISIILLWITLNQRIENFPVYIYNSLEIAKGYNGAMGIPTAIPVLVAAVLIGLVFTVVFLGSMIKKERDISLLCILSSFCIFSSYKSAIVRSDLHIIVLFQVSLFFFCLLLFLLCNQKRGEIVKDRTLVYFNQFCVISLLLGIILSSSCLIHLDIYQKQVPVMNGDNINEYFYLLNKTNFYAETSANIQMVKDSYRLDNETDVPIAGRYDIIPWDVTYLYAHNLTYHPRPVFQSFSAYTSKLDRINGNSLKESPPDHIIYSNITIDHRYPLFEEPSVITEIFHNYSVNNILSDFVILEKKNETQPITRKFVGSGIYSFGEEIQLPSMGKIIGEVKIRQTIIGFMKGYLYKPSQVYVQFILTDGTQSTKYRIIPDVIQNGVILSPYVSNLSDFVNLFSNEGTPVEKIVFTHDPSRDWDENITIDFYSEGKIAENAM